MNLLNEKVAIVTGGGNGIGQATAIALARQGAQVLVNDVGAARDGTGTDPAVAEAVAEQIRAEGGRAVSCDHSVATAAGAQAIVASALDAFGRVDVLINNAGIIADRTLLKLDEQRWDAVLSVQLKGTFLCTQAAARVMRDQGGGGRIVNTTGVSGLVGNFGQANFAAACAGVYGLTRTASIELQRHEITVNAVAPVARTRMTEDLAMFERIHDDSLSVQHVVPAHLFFASDLCRDRTGFVMAVAGAKLSLYRLVETSGRFKEADAGAWTAEEIDEHWAGIARM